MYLNRVRVNILMYPFKVLFWSVRQRKTRPLGAGSHCVMLTSLVAVFKSDALLPDAADSSELLPVLNTAAGAIWENREC